MYKTICNYLLYKIFYLLRKQARLPARDFLIPTVGPKRRLPVPAHAGPIACASSPRRLLWPISEIVNSLSVNTSLRRLLSAHHDAARADSHTG